MSSTGSLRSGQPALRLYSVFLRRAPRARGLHRAHAARLFAAIGSSGHAARRRRHPCDRRRSATTATTTPPGPGRQLAAIIASGDRTAELNGASPRRRSSSTAPPTGSSRPSGGRATARAIRGAKLMTIPGYGPRPAARRLADADRRDRRACRQADGQPLRTRPYRPRRRPSRACRADLLPPSSPPRGVCCCSSRISGVCARASSTSGSARARAPASADRGGSASAGRPAGMHGRSMRSLVAERTPQIHDLPPRIPARVWSRVSPPT